MFNNKNGLSSILFAMVFTVVLSLLAIGIATLARNDQRQVIDQNLGFQAQYAAESAVNLVQAEVVENGSLTPPKRTNCAGSAQYNIDDNNNAKVTCVQWNNETPTVILDGLDTSPISLPITTTTGSISTISFTWISSEDTDTPYGGSGFPSAISSSRIPLLKLAMVESSGEASFKQIYMVPRGSGSSVAYGSITDGAVYNANCNASNECTMEISNPNIVNGYLAISALGGIVERTVIEITGSEFQDVQYIVDATAVAEDVTKRVEARIGTGSSWRPGFAVSADQVCKDIRIDGPNSSAYSSGGSVCP